VRPFVLTAEFARLVQGRDLITSQVSDLSTKLAQAETKLVQLGRRGYSLPSDKKEESPLQDLAEERYDASSELPCRRLSLQC